MPRQWAPPGSAARKQASELPQDFQRLSTRRMDELSFLQLCQQFEKACRKTKSQAKLKLLIPPNLLRDVGASQSRFPLVRLILPHIDGARPSYNVKIQSLINFYCHNLGLPASAAHAVRLTKYKYPLGDAGDAVVGNFPGVLEWVLTERLFTNSHGKTVGDVNATLDALAAARSPDDRKAVMMQILQNYSALEQKWLVRIILKDLAGLGLRHEVALRYLHPDAPDMYNVCTNLEQTVDTLVDPNMRRAIEVALGRAFHPMLAHKNESIRQYDKKFEGVGVVEPKLDGERLLVHKQGSRVQMFTRNQNEYTELYGPALAQHLRDCLASVENCILDGEVVSWDDEAQRLLPFGSNKTTANLYKDGSDLCRRFFMTYVAFDCLHVSGRGADEARRTSDGDAMRALGSSGSLTGAPLARRMRVLRHIVTPRPHRVEIVPQVTVAHDSLDEREKRVCEELDRALQQGYEGLIIKDQTSHYICGQNSRNARRWIKVKPDYGNGGDTIDAVVVGGYYGEGRRRVGKLSTWLLAVRADGGAKEKFFTFCKVGTGYSVDTLEQINRKLADHLEPWDDANVPAFLQGWRPCKADDRPDAWVHPKHSIVFELTCAEMQVTSQFLARVTARFPRVHSVRMDKDDPARDCATLSQVQELMRTGVFSRRTGSAAGRRARSKKRRVVDGTGAEVGAKTMKRRRGPAAPAAEYTAIDPGSVSRESDALQGLEFCVMPGPYVCAADDGDDDERSTTTTVTKAALEQIVLRLGGRVTSNAMASTLYLVAPDARSVKVQNVIAQNRIDVVTAGWLLACDAARARVPLRAVHVLHARPDTAARMSQSQDRFGDAYMEDTSAGELGALLARMPEPDHDVPWQDTLRGMREAGDPLAAELCAAMDAERPTALGSVFAYVDQYRTLSLADGPVADVGVPEEQLRFGGAAADVLMESAELRQAPGHPLAVVAARLRACGAVVLDELTPQVTHIVIDARDRTRDLELRRYITDMTLRGVARPHYVEQGWAAACVERGERVGEGGGT